MINRIKALFTAEGAGATPDQRAHGFDELQVAAAALLVEAATMDDSFDAREQAKIVELIRGRFGLSREEADDLVALAEHRVAESHQHFGFTRVIKDRYSHDERVALLEMLWEVAYVDGELHDYEASLIRRIAGLIYVPDRDSGAARKRALGRLGLEP